MIGDGREVGVGPICLVRTEGLARIGLLDFKWTGTSKMSNIGGIISGSGELTVVDVRFGEEVCTGRRGTRALRKIGIC